MNLTNILSYLTKRDQDKVHLLFRRLVPHLSPGQFAVTGGLALRYHLSKNHFLTLPKNLNDIDMVVKDSETIHASITNDFLVNHYHLSGEDKKLFIQLVDHVSKTRTDLFPSFEKILSRANTFKLGIFNLQVISLEDLLVQITLITQGVMKNRIVSPKHFKNMNTLLQMANLDKAEDIWFEVTDKQSVGTFREAVAKAKNALRNRSIFIKNQKYSADKSYTCIKCDQVIEFPIAKAKEVIDIIGYI